MARTHGLAGTYQGGCRCAPCTDANRRDNARRRQQRLEVAVTDPTQVPHGASAYTNWGCRCDECKAAVRERSAGDWDLSRKGKRWTANEIRLALRDDLSAREIAQRLKRPYRSIAVMRYQVRKGGAA